MSVKAEIYADIKTALEGISSIKNVLHYNGQDLQLFEKTVSKNFPQAWIQLSNIEWGPSELAAYNENTTQQQKTAAVTITIYFANHQLKEDDDTFETDLVIIDEMYRALTLLNGNNYGPLQRQAENDVPTAIGVRVWAQTYTTMLTECGVSKGQTDATTQEEPLTLTIIKTILS